VRSAAILGVVGAGGIGFLMSDKINGYQYREVCSMMIVVIIAVSLIDLACTRLMRAVV
jgi:phosphonate transport system permease protein